MPLILDDLVEQMNQTGTSGTAYSPKFFDKKLTGSGKKTGIISEMADPEHINPAIVKNCGYSMDEFMRSRKRTYTNGDTEVLLVNMGILTKQIGDYYENRPVPELSEMLKIYSKPCVTAANAPYEKNIYMSMRPYSLILEERESAANNSGQPSSKIRRLIVCYEIMYVGVCEYPNNNPPVNDRMQFTDNILSRVRYMKDPIFSLAWTIDLRQELIGTMNGLTKNPDLKPVNDFIDNYSLYDGICAQAEDWVTKTDTILDGLFGYLATIKSDTVLNEIAKLLRRLEDYSVPLDRYIKIYNSLEAYFDPDEVIALSKQNMYLLLSNTLDSMNKNRNLISGIPQVNPPIAVTLPNGSTPSPEQAKAIAATEPLILVQSGAGSGKSTVIHARMEYMMKAGVKPEDIMVLSFTNAAANHINELCPEVHSMTIAKMIDTIYHANFPNHMLSSVDTIINCLDIYFGATDPVADRLKWKLTDIVKNKSNAFIGLNNFIETNYDAVINILDTIGQTSLELEIVICYQKIDTFVEPPEVQSKYLIIDEVQDNSVFEFVYAIKYVEKHKESLFIVGDGSQTLYEFRASNPKALNVLEASGVFKTYQLQINYRSNQEILDFANVLLGRIEANQYAHIQLQANNLTPVTAKSFQQKVCFRYRQLAKISEFNENMDAIFAVEVKPYVDQCLARGSKVAFLAFTRFDINRIQGILQKLYPTKSVVNIVSKKGYDNVVFSEFIKKFWNQVQFTPTMSIISVVHQMVMANLAKLVYDEVKMKPTVLRLLTGWETEQGPAIKAWQDAYVKNTMTLDDFMENVRNSMLGFEIRNNSIRQALLSAKNEEQKNAQIVAAADMIVSTIHGAKGLEFPNVVVLMRNENSMSEEKKRMYYVALTRAMESECVLAYDTTVKPKVLMDYEEIVNKLTARANPQAAAMGQDDEDEDVDFANAANQDIAMAQQHLKDIAKKERPKAYPKGMAPVAKDDDSDHTDENWEDDTESD